VTIGAVLVQDIVRGPQVQRVPADQAARRVRELLSRARHEHLAMYDAMTVDDEAVQRALPAARERRERGVRLRTMAPIGAATPAVTDSDLLALDGDHRRAPGLPTSLNVLDRRVALLPAGQGEPEGGYWEIWSPPLVAGLVALFRRTWAAASPSTLSLREREIVALLAEGWTDTVVARRLGISQRTVTATVRALMDRYGARSRFQLAVEMSRRL
jgi:DNA-binding CsgD family transcriptional regulator